MVGQGRPGSSFEDGISDAAARPSLSLQVKTDLSQPYTLFHGDIRNFTYEPGYAYTLRVSKTEVPNPPADGASFYYTCLEVLAKVELAKEFPQLLPFEGTLWTLSGFPASGRQIVASPRGPPTLKVQDGHATGLASVNQYSAVVSISGNTITVGNVGTTRMMGPENLMEQEAYFVSALGNCTTFRVHAEQNIVILELSDAQGQVLLAFDGPKSAPTPAPDPMPASLLGTSWVLTSLNGSTPIERAPTLFFSDSEPVRVSGTSTINHYSGSVDITGSSISFGKNIASTMMAGPPEQMEQESLYFKALTSVASYALRTRADGSQLDMRDSEGNLVLVFKQTKA